MTWQDVLWNLGKLGMRLDAVPVVRLIAIWRGGWLRVVIDHAAAYPAPGIRLLVALVALLAQSPP